MQHAFTVAGEGGEAVATITAGCAQCDWGVEGREAVLLRIDVDGRYSQHLALTRGEPSRTTGSSSEALAAGRHRLIDRA